MDDTIDVTKLITHDPQLLIGFVGFCIMNLALEHQNRELLLSQSYNLHSLTQIWLKTMKIIPHGVILFNKKTLKFEYVN